MNYFYVFKTCINSVTVQVVTSAPAMNPEKKVIQITFDTLLKYFINRLELYVVIFDCMSIYATIVAYYFLICNGLTPNYSPIRNLTVAYMHLLRFLLRITLYYFTGISF